MENKKQEKYDKFKVIIAAEIIVAIIAVIFFINAAAAPDKNKKNTSEIVKKVPSAGVVVALEKYADSASEESIKILSEKTRILNCITGGIEKSGKISEDVQKQVMADTPEMETEDVLEQEPAIATVLAYIEPAAPDSDDVAALRQAVANYAQQFVGVLPYVYGGNSLETGADCSGFVQAVYAAYGYSLPRISDEQTYGGTPVSMDDLRPGDVVGYGGHVAIYVGDGTVVHAPVPGRYVEYSSINMMPVVNVSRYIN